MIWRRILMVVMALALAGGFTIAAANDDVDYDGKANDVDNCPTTYNPDQKDTDWDMMGDACDADADNDGVANAADADPLDASVS